MPVIGNRYRVTFKGSTGHVSGAIYTVESYDGETVKFNGYGYEFPVDSIQLTELTAAKLGTVQGHQIIYEKWSPLMGGNGISGTIRTVPANYYVATITETGCLLFQELEGNTKNIDKEQVTELFAKFIESEQ